MLRAQVEGLSGMMTSERWPEGLVMVVAAELLLQEAGALPMSSGEGDETAAGRRRWAACSAGRWGKGG